MVPVPIAHRNARVWFGTLATLATLLLCFAWAQTARSAPKDPNEAAATRFGDPIFSPATGLREVTITAEIAQLENALKAYKERYGSYPPSDFTKLDDMKSPQYKAVSVHLDHIFPRCDASVEIAAIKKLGVKSPAQALCFWLLGFTSDPAHPISRLLDEPSDRTAVFKFDEIRLKYPAGEKSCPVYVPPGGGDAPYVYFSSVSYQTQAPFNADFKQGGTGIAKPYRADKTVAGRFVNPKSFQIISAGADDDYGGGKGSFPSGTGYAAGDKDNLTNFTLGTLGDAIPK